MSRDLKDLILRLLAKEPERRLGHKGASEVKSHSFFKGINWDDVLKKKLIAPFVPTLRGEEDVRYFRDVRGIFRRIIIIMDELGSRLFRDTSTKHP